MEIRPLDEQVGGDLDAALTQANTKTFAQQLESNPLLGGHLLGPIDLVGAGTTQINHRLGQQIRGWIVTDVESAGAPTVIRTDWDKETIALQASVACTVSLWVF